MTRPNSIAPTLDEYAINRFWLSVDKSQGHGPNGDCWEWQGPRSRGYGHFWFNWRTLRAHRVAYFLNSGDWPSELVLHTCDNHPCCRPDHLWVGTNLDNIEDRHRKGRDAKGERNARYTCPETTVRGERHPRAKTTEKQVLQIRQRHACGDVNAKEVAREFNVSHAMVLQIVKRQTWKHI